MTLKSILASSLLTLSTAAAYAQTTYYVNDGSVAGDKFCTATGNDANPGTAPGTPKSTINAAMALASSGDRIMVDNGTYLVSNLVIKAGVKVVGASPDNTILRVQSAGAPIQMASNTELWNCQLYRAVPGVAGGAPTITLSNQSGSDNVRIENCFFFKNRTAIYLNWGTNTTIARNRFDDNRTGILIDVFGNTNHDGLMIRDNEIRNCRSYGIILLGPADNSQHTGYAKAAIDNNIFTGNLAGAMENNNTNPASELKMRNNWFGHTPAEVNAMRTNGGFNVADHDGTGFNNPTFTDNGTLLGADYPNDISGANTSGLSVLTHATAAPLGAGPTLFVKSTNPAFDYYTHVQDAVNGSAAGAVVTIPDGIFREDVNISKPIRVNGTSQNGTILKGLYYGGSAHTVEISADNASVNNLTITRDYGTTTTEWFAATKNQGLTVNANNDTVSAVKVTGNRNGIYVNNRQGVVILNSHITANRTGIQMGNDVSNGKITNNIIDNNFTHGLMINADLSGTPNATNLVIRNNRIAGNWYTQLYLNGANTINTANAAISCNDYGTNAPTKAASAAGEPGYATQVPVQLGGSAPATNFSDMAGTQINGTATAPWLINAVDAQSGMSGFQRTTSLAVAPVTPPLSAANNDYRILANAIGCAETGNTITLNGTFDWTTAEAAAAWALGNDGITQGGTPAPYSGSGDDYSILAPDFVDSVTLTSGGTATIQGPGDLAGVALENALFFNSNKPNSHCNNWTISNIKFYDLDVAVIADHNGGPVTPMKGFTFINNEVRIPVDLNHTVALADNFQNLGLHLNYGKDQTVSGNNFIIDGTGTSDPGNAYSTTVAIQSATGGGDAYDNLKIQNNQFHITGMPAAQPARIVGVWENGNNQTAAIDISGNTFVNDDAGNTAANNSQLAFRITSYSGDAAHQVIYQNNEVTGFNRAFDYLGDPFAGYTPNLYYAAANPVVIKNNKVQDVKYGVTVRKDPASTNTGAPAIINNNAFTGVVAGGYAISNMAIGTNAEATCNYLDSPLVQPGANVTFLPKLSSGIDAAPGTVGFQPAGVCEGPVRNINQNTDYVTVQSAVNAANTGDTIEVGYGVYYERVVVDKPLTLRGDPHYGRANMVLDGTGLSSTGSGITLNSGIENIHIENLTIRNFAGSAPNTHAGIRGTGNNHLLIERVDALNNNGGAGIFLAGPINDVMIDSVRASNHSNINGAARGIVIWDALKTRITIQNSIVENNSCCGIELQDGNASGVTIKNNTISGVDNGIGLIGLTSGAGPNIIEGNQVTITGGRFGIEIKNPNGTGSTNDTEDGAIIVRNNNVQLASTTDSRDLAGIAVFRRGVTSGNADAPMGVAVMNNTVSNFTQPSVSEGFGIVIEGIHHTVTGNILTGNEVGIQQQAGYGGYPGDGDQSNLADTFFGRGNSPMTCSNILTPNTFNSNTVETRNIAVGDGAVTNISTNKTFCSIQAAINDAATVAGNIIEIGTGNFNEQVLVNKSVTLRNKPGAFPVIDFSSMVTGKPALFDVSADKVTIDSLHFNVDLSKLRSAIIVSGAGIDSVTIKDNLIEPYGTPAGAYGDRNAVSVNYGGPANYRIATGGVNKIIFDHNIVTVNGVSAFRSGISADESGGDFTNNTLQSINQDIIVRFGSNGDVNVLNNQLKGGGVELTEHNAGAGKFTVSGNTFDGTFANAYTSSLRLKNNTHGKATYVTNNIFVNNTWAISLENYRADTIDNNVFTPLASATAFRHITVNTKLIATTALASIQRQAVDATITGNTFNGSPVATNGKGLAFYNHWNDGGALYGNFDIAGNTFNTNITQYIYLDGMNNGQATSTMTGAYPEYTGIVSSTAGAWSQNIGGGSTSTFEGISGPTGTLAQNFTIEDKIVHKIDNGALGFVTVNDGHTYVTNNSFIAPMTMAPKVQRGVDAASPGWTEHIQAGTYQDNVIVNKAVTITGEGSGNTKVNSVTANGNIFTIAANGITVKNLQAEGTPVSGSSATRGFYINSAANNITIDSVLASLHQMAIYADNAAVIDTMNVMHSELAACGNGFHVEAQAQVKHLVVDGNKIHDNLYGMSSTANSAVSNNETGLEYVTIVNNSFVNNANKGLYFEKLNHAMISGDTLSNNGTVASSPTGLDVNLKYGTYDDIAINGNILSVNGAGSATGGGITVKARNDGSFAANPATLANLTLANNEISGSPVGMAVGNDVDRSSTSVANNLITGATRGFVSYGADANAVTILTSNSIAATNFAIENGDANTNIAATCNWLGSFSPGAQVSGTADYNPWLLNGADDPAFVGFQPQGTCENRPTAVLSGTDTICPATSGTLNIVLIGTQPWSLTYTDGTTPVTVTGITSSPYTITVNPVATATYTITALSDAHYPALPNDISGTVTMTVGDFEAPVISGCPGDRHLNTDANSCTAIALWGEPTATDNCTATGNLVWVKSHSSGDTFALGTTLVTYVVTDAQGRSDTCSFNVIVTDSTAPVFASCPAPYNITVNNGGCTGNITTADPQVTDNCTLSTLTWSLSGADTGSSPATGMNYLGMHSFPVGVTTVTYTATDAAGNTQTCIYTVTINAPVMNGMISGTSSVQQNAATTSNITFAATGGMAPYTFTYTVNGGSPQVISTVGSGTMTTVPQSNAVQGQFIYTLTGVTDANGCSGTLPADDKDTITVTAPVVSSNLAPIVVVPNPSFNNTVTDRAFDVNIYNLGTNSSAGTIGFYILKPAVPGSSISFDPAWTVTESPSFYLVESATAVIPGNFGLVTIPATLHMDPSVAPGRYTMQVLLVPNTGGDNTPGNNTATVNLNKTN